MHNFANGNKAVNRTTIKRINVCLNSTEMVYKQKISSRMGL